ncbi:MAG: sulfur carrier protein ThiS [Gammaproteobacteria bacterium]|nr:sulfur carrier protein ThiS [Gammaproteobacteria bacterium]MDD9806953.1 sulfur carrier protein ThiS [Gammaproteobacteria bacterium]MDD9869261.1 sulfur carrier protein ThiS [Gammaproteobacteria bacterium]MDD9886757.1 sulfur carrier protein ThiS [Gammaproteobacteria bacterium]
MGSIEIRVNGTARTLPDGATLGALVETLAAGRKIAVEVNGGVVPRAEHAAFRLSAGDRVEIIEAIGGG